MTIIYNKHLHVLNAKIKNINERHNLSKAMNIPISAVLVTFNEDFYLRECLQSISWANEIVLCDMGSTDGTIAIAKELGCKIVDIDKAEYVESVRSMAVSHCRNEWVCFMDPDFVFPVGSLNTVHKVLSENESVSCINFSYRNHYGGRPVRYGRWGRGGIYPLLFKRSAMELRPILHNGFKLTHGVQYDMPKKYYIKHMWIRDDAHFMKKHTKYISHEGSRRFQLGMTPSNDGYIRLLLKCLYYYIFKGGVLDGSVGYYLLKKNIWYEIQSENKLRELYHSVAEKYISECKICGSTKQLPVRSLYDDRYGYNSIFILYVCANCQHKTIMPEISADEIGQLYTNYYPRSTFSEKEHVPYAPVGVIRSWLDGMRSHAFMWVPKNVKVLDVGCGYAQSLGYHTGRGCECYGVEADSNVKKVVDMYGYKIYIGLFDSTIYEKDFFDYITLDQVAEHLSNPAEMLRGIASILKPSGKIILSTPNSSGWGSFVFRRRWINWHAPYHCNFFSVKSLHTVANDAGLVVEVMRTITPSEWLKYQWIHTIMYPPVGVASTFWVNKDKRNYNRKLKKIIFYLATSISYTSHKLRINHLITRLFDILGVGDNYVVIMRKKDL